MAHRLGVDVGGTFAQSLLPGEGSGAPYRAKVPSTPEDSSIGVPSGAVRICAESA
jgi:N-methylhydantoinase A